MPYWPLFILFLLGGSVSIAQPAVDHRAGVDSLFAAWDKTTSPGCALGVISDGELIYKRGYGMANLDYGIANTSRSVFRIGSTSKQFTAACILLLEQEGKLSLNDDIRKYFPELPDYGAAIRISHLLHHTSGIRDYLTLFFLAGLDSDDHFYTDDDVLRMIFRQKTLNFDPGTEYLYCNSGYFLLGQIVRKVTGKSMRVYAHERIFRPLGMDDTHFHDDHKEIVRNRAYGYAPKAEGFEVSMTTLDMIGDGGVFTTVENLLKWDRNFYEPKVGGPAFIEKMTAIGRFNDGREVVVDPGEGLFYASGLMVGTYGGLPTVSHGGSFVGYRAEMLRFPEQRLTVICLANLASFRPEELCRKVAEVYLGDRMDGSQRKERSRVVSKEEGSSSMLTIADLGGFPGKYYSEELDATYQFDGSGEKLTLTVDGRPKGEVTYSVESKDHLSVGKYLSLDILREGGTITGYNLGAGRSKNIIFRKVE